MKVEPKQILKKDSLISNTKKRKLTQEIRKKKQWKDLDKHDNIRDEMKVDSDTVDENKVEGLDKKRLVFIEKNLYKIANLDSKTCKNKTMKGKLGNDSITSSLYKMNKFKFNRVRQFKPCNNSRLRSWFCCCKDSKVVNCVRFCFRDCIEYFPFVPKKTFS